LTEPSYGAHDDIERVEAPVLGSSLLDGESKQHDSSIKKTPGSSKSGAASPLSLHDVFQSRISADAGGLLSTSLVGPGGFPVTTEISADVTRQKMAQGCTALDVLHSPGDEANAALQYEGLRAAISSVATAVSVQHIDTPHHTEIAAEGVNGQLLFTPRESSDADSYVDDGFESSDSSSQVQQEAPHEELSQAFDCEQRVKSTMLSSCTLPADLLGLPHPPSHSSPQVLGLSVDVSSEVGMLSPGAALQATPPALCDDDEPTAVLQPTPHAAAAGHAAGPSSFYDATLDARDRHAYPHNFGDPQAPPTGTPLHQTAPLKQHAGAQKQNTTVPAFGRQLETFQPAFTSATATGGVFIKHRMHAKPSGAPPGHPIPTSHPRDKGGRQAEGSGGYEALDGKVHTSFVDTLSESSMDGAMACATNPPSKNVTVDWSVSESGGDI
jgi:hypothetical protein